MLKVGLTGGIASGKTTVSDHFCQLGIQVVDADIVAREVVAQGQPALTEIANHFGEQIINADGSLNRRRLRESIFSCEQDKDWLNALLHPLIHQGIKQQLASATSPYVILSAPLLLENGLDNLVDRIAVVDIPQALQLQRTAQRDGVSQQQAQAIIDAQVPRDDRLQAADDIISNSCGREQLLSQVENLHQFYLKLGTK